MKIQNILRFLILCVTFAFSIFINYENRNYDWDLPGYVGSVLAAEFPGNFDKVHQLTFQSIKQEAPESEFTHIIKGNNARKSFYENAQSFSEQLPYYQVKVLFVAAIDFFYKLGFSLPKSVLVTNLTSCFLAGIFVFLILGHIFPQRGWLVFSLSLFIFLLPLFSDLAIAPNPDMFGFMVLLAFFYAYLKKYPLLLRFLLMVCLVLIRADYLIFGLSYLFFELLVNYSKSKKVDFKIIGYSLILFAMYFSLIKFYHYPGWKDLFYDSFISRRNFISKQNPDFTWREYTNVAFGNLLNMKKVILSSSILMIASLYLGKKKEEKLFAILLFVNIYMKFFLFPAAGQFRFFFPFIILQLFWMFILMQKNLNNKSLKTVFGQ